MDQSQRTSARDFFLYLFATGALYFSAVSVISLLWQYVNHFYPDPLAYYEDGLSSGMRWAVATLIIVFPTYIWIMRFLGKDLDKNPEKREIGVRKVMIYLTLFIAAVTILVDLVMLVNNFLGGDMTVQFGLKALSVLVVAAGVFKYYLFNLHREPGTKAQARNVIAWGSLTAILVLVIGAFFIVGSPATNRVRKFDNQRVNDLQMIQWQVINYWQQKAQLPKVVTDLNDSLSGFTVPVDPETGTPYDYKATASNTFELCGTFGLVSSPTGMMGAYPYKTAPVPMGATDYAPSVPDNWQHAAGHVCFSRTIDPDRFPPIKK